MPRFGGTDACAEVRDVLPLRASEAWEEAWTGPVEAHLAQCEACRAEAAFVDRIRSFRLEPPAALAGAVMERFEAEHRAPARRRWMTSSIGLSAAAAAVLAIGIGIFGNRGQATDPLWEMALEPDAPAWYGEEWLVAGGAVPEALSDDVLLLLAQEMDL